ncbi:MAG: dephospho-CoA kinase, partial [Halobacteriovoraceae bacterium]|nr:dephospho-CoA kinase [Halobacteriovoraceae bacterium]
MKLKRKHVRLTPKERLYNLHNPLVGLSGGIAGGKSTVAEFFKEKNIKVICADVLVKRLYR